MVKEMEEEEEDEEEDSLEYATDTPLGGSYTTPPSTGGRSKSPPTPSCLPTPGDSDPENNTVLCAEELENCIKVFLEEAEEDMEIDDLPSLENALPLLVPAPVIPGFVPFAISTGQHCVPCKSLLRKIWHLSSDTIFTSNFGPFLTQLQPPSLPPPFSSMFIFLMVILLCLIHTHEQTTRTSFIGTTSHGQLDLLGYRHPETVLFPFPNPILRQNPLSHSCLLPQLKVLDFLDTEHE